jgi:cell division protein FtsW
MGRKKRGDSGPGSTRQLTLTGFLEDLAKRAEFHDPARPATRLFLTVLALMGLGLLLQASHAATTLPMEEFRDELSGQLAFRLIAVAALLLGFRLGPAGIRPVVPYLLAVAGVMLVLVFVPGVGGPINGSHRWLRVAGLSFQPSELARIALVLWLADRCVRLGGRVHDVGRGVAPMMAVVAVCFGLILIETDLGGAMLLLICALSTMWVGGARMLPVFGGFVAVGGGAIISMMTVVPYARDRIAMWFGHVRNAQVAGTVDAMSSGHLTGSGLSHGTFRIAGVPYLESDYVFALVGEELGVLGMLLVLALLCAFLWFALRLVLSVDDRYSALVAFGLLVSVGVQAMVHVQVVSGLAPPKGMTLPFISDGGTSLVVSSLAVGLAVGAARTQRQELLPCSPSNATA